jgi:hypothetical protein
MNPLLVLALMTLPTGACSGSETPGVEVPRVDAPGIVRASADAAALAGKPISGKIVETMDAAGYTYVLVDTGDLQVWAAGPRTAVKVGENVVLTGGMPMENFRSQTLDRTFDVVIFVGSLKGSEGIASAPRGSGIQQAIPGHETASEQATPAAAVDLTDIQKVSGGNTVAELFAGKQELADTEVSVRGRVVKFNSGIMGRNWIHIQDGSGSEGSNDLTVTTEDTVRPGDLVVIRGTLKTNQDFGSGYSYEILVEKAKVSVE